MPAFIGHRIWICLSASIEEEGLESRSCAFDLAASYHVGKRVFPGQRDLTLEHYIARVQLWNHGMDGYNYIALTLEELPKYRHHSTVARQLSRVDVQRGNSRHMEQWLLEYLGGCD